MNRDADGFLVDWTTWNETISVAIAEAEGIVLTESHWEIIRLSRDFYTAFDHAPSQRPLARYIKAQLGPDKAASIYLMQLFGQSPAKMVARLSGLPKPKNCL